MSHIEIQLSFNNKINILCQNQSMHGLSMPWRALL